MNKGLIGGIFMVIALWIIAYSQRNTLGFGMAILPLILISMVILIGGYFLGKIFKKRR